jgi:hypothetical protein
MRDERLDTERAIDLFEGVGFNSGWLQGRSSTVLISFPTWKSIRCLVQSVCVYVPNILSVVLSVYCLVAQNRIGEITV